METFDISKAMKILHEEFGKEIQITVLRAVVCDFFSIAMFHYNNKGTSHCDSPFFLFIHHKWKALRPF